MCAAACLFRSPRIMFVTFSFIYRGFIVRHLVVDGVALGARRSGFRIRRRSRRGRGRPLGDLMGKKVWQEGVDIHVEIELIWRRITTHLVASRVRTTGYEERRVKRSRGPPWLGARGPRSGGHGREKSGRCGPRDDSRFSQNPHSYPS